MKTVVPENPSSTKSFLFLKPCSAAYLDNNAFVKGIVNGERKNRQVGNNIICVLLNEDSNCEKYSSFLWLHITNSHAIISTVLHQMEEYPSYI